MQHFVIFVSLFAYALSAGCTIVSCLVDNKNSPTAELAFGNGTLHATAASFTVTGKITASNVATNTLNATNLGVVGTISTSFLKCQNTLTANFVNATVLSAQNIIANTISASAATFGALTVNGVSNLNFLDIITLHGLNGTFDVGLQVQGVASLATATALSLDVDSLWSGDATLEALTVPGTSSLQAVSATTVAASSIIAADVFVANLHGGIGNFTTNLTVQGPSYLQHVTASNLVVTNTLSASSLSITNLDATQITAINVTATEFISTGPIYGASLNVNGPSTLAHLSAGTLTLSGVANLYSDLNVAGDTNLNWNPNGVQRVKTGINSNGIRGTKQGHALCVGDDGYLCRCGYCA